MKRMARRVGYNDAMIVNQEHGWIRKESETTEESKRDWKGE